MIINKCRKMDESFKYVIKTIFSMVNYAFILSEISLNSQYSMKRVYYASLKYKTSFRTNNGDF